MNEKKNFYLNEKEFFYLNGKSFLAALMSFSRLFFVILSINLLANTGINQFQLNMITSIALLLFKLPRFIINRCKTYILTILKQFSGNQQNMKTILGLFFIAMGNILRSTHFRNFKLAFRKGKNKTNKYYFLHYVLF